MERRMKIIYGIVRECEIKKAIKRNLKRRGEGRIESSRGRSTG